jgi:hypothetical protein
MTMPGEAAAEATVRHSASAAPPLGEVTDAAASDEQQREGQRPDLLLERQFRDGEGELERETAHVWDLTTGQDVITNSWAKAVNERLDPVKTRKRSTTSSPKRANCPRSTPVKVSA